MIGYVIGLHCPYQGYTGTMYVLAKLTEVMRFIKKKKFNGVTVVMAVGKQIGPCGKLVTILL